MKTDSPQNTPLNISPKLTILDIKKNSLNKFKLGGAEALPTQRINQKKQNRGDSLIIPRFRYNLREPLFSYKHCTPKNRPEEQRPCDIKIPTIPLTPIKSQENLAAKINDMCATEEYAINDFKSHCRKHIKPTTHIVITLQIKKKSVQKQIFISKKCNERTSP